MVKLVAVTAARRTTCATSALLAIQMAIHQTADNPWPGRFCILARYN